MSHRLEMRREVAEALGATAEAITTAGGGCGDLSSSQRPRHRLNQAASPYDSVVSGPSGKCFRKESQSRSTGMDSDLQGAPCTLSYRWMTCTNYKNKKGLRSSVVQAPPFCFVR
eukprot:COSAG01_NODE_592_length_15109_cov_39.247435_3_plen_114_part_00